jgi:hypothetical protein
MEECWQHINADNAQLVGEECASSARPPYHTHSHPSCLPAAPVPPPALVSSIHPLTHFLLCPPPHPLTPGTPDLLMVVKAECAKAGWPLGANTPAAALLISRLAQEGRPHRWGLWEEGVGVGA